MTTRPTVPIHEKVDEGGDEVALDEWLANRLRDIEANVTHARDNLADDAFSILDAMGEIANLASQIEETLRDNLDAGDVVAYDAATVPDIFAELVEGSEP